MARRSGLLTFARRLLYALLAVVLVPSAAIVVWLAWFFDLNDHKPEIRAAVADIAGIDLALNGDIRLRPLFGLDTGVLRLSARDLVLGATGRPVAEVEQLELEIALAPLLAGEVAIERIRGRVLALDLVWDAAGVFNLAPRLSSDGAAASAGLPSWLRGLRIERIDARLEQGRYRDLESDHELALEQADIRLGPLHIIANGRLVADSPALLMAFQLAAELNAGRFRLGSVAGRGLRLALRNDHGVIAFERLAMDALALGDPGAGSAELEGSAIDLGGSLELAYAPPAGDWADVQWGAVQRVELHQLALKAGRLRAGALHFSGLEASTPRLTLLADGRAPDPGLGAGPQQWLGSVSEPIAVSGKLLSTATLSLADYRLALRMRGGQPSLAVEQGTLALDPSASGGAVVSGQVRGELRLTLEGHGGNVPAAALPLRTVFVSAATLQAQDLLVGGGQAVYRLATLALELERLPLILAGRRLDPVLPRDRLAALSKLSVRADATGITHQGEADHVDALSLAVEGRSGVLAVTHMNARLDETTLQGSAEVALNTDTGVAGDWRLSLASQGVSIKALAEIADLPLNPDGRLALELDLRGEGLDPERLAHSLTGHLSSDSDGMDLLDLDLDKFLTHLQYTQQGDLFDVSLFLLAGPASSLLMTASDLDQMIATAEAQGRSRIVAARSAVRIDDGVLHIDEAALATPQHRMAIRGSVSLYDEGPVALEIATVDADGCALFREDIGGTLANPDVSHGGMLAKTLVQPLRTLADKLLPGARCREPFYSGAVPPPRISRD